MPLVQSLKKYVGNRSKREDVWSTAVDILDVYTVRMQCGSSEALVVSLLEFTEFKHASQA